MATRHEEESEGEQRQAQRGDACETARSRLFILVEIINCVEIQRREAKLETLEHWKSEVFANNNASFVAKRFRRKGLNLCVVLKSK